MYQRKSTSGTGTAVLPETQPIGVRRQPHASDDGFRIEWHRSHIPGFVESELDRLYGSIYSSLAQLEVEGSTVGVHTYVVYRNGKIVDLWLFRIEEHAVRVLNEAIPVDAAAVQRFADTVFPSNPPVDMMIFNAVYPALDGLRLPLQRLHGTDDSVLTLPATGDAYVAGLGKATRKNLRRYLNRLSDTFPTFRYQVYETQDIPDEAVHAIVRLNRTRMAAKGKTSGISDAQARRMLALVRRCGLVGVATIDGRVCAGAIAYRAGRNYFSFVRAHDPAYNDYRLGLIGAYHLVCACIARGGQELHFMWGREPHKSLIGGEQRTLDRIIIFRSHWRALLHVHLLLKNAVSDSIRRAKLRLLAKSGDRDDLVARMLRQGLATGRALKRRMLGENGRENAP